MTAVSIISARAGSFGPAGAPSGACPAGVVDSATGSDLEAGAGSISSLRAASPSFRRSALVASFEPEDFFFDADLVPASALGLTATVARERRVFRRAALFDRLGMDRARVVIGYAVLRPG